MNEIKTKRILENTQTEDSKLYFYLKKYLAVLNLSCFFTLSRKGEDLQFRQYCKIFKKSYTIFKNIIAKDL